MADTDEDGDSGGVAVVAENLKEAFKLGRAYWGAEIGFDNEYIEQRCHLIKNQSSISGLPKGVVLGKEGLKHGLYGWIEDTCDQCGKNTKLYQVLTDSGKCICEECDERILKNMKQTKLYYRMDARSAGAVLNVCPKTSKEVQRLKIREQDMWIRLAGREDKDMMAFKRYRTEAEQKLKSLEEK